ncbi:MAG TPA: DUF423 domain-containing protein [Gammaproteobacteria bacterium]|nr:DUF423 domain-containing protein [Gammaproteobacteria bacterium]
MIGKKNIVFGFLYLVLTASLGPYMVVELLPTVSEAQLLKQQDVGPLQLLAENDFEDENTMAPISAKQLAMANTKGILALNQLVNANAPIDSMKGGPHAHGNLEAVLNILAGLVLCFLAAPVLVKQLISWLFIAGALLHSGSLYLLAFDMAWAGTLLQIGPWLVLLALLTAGISSLIWLQTEPVRD